HRFVSVTPKSSVYHEYYLSRSLSSASLSELTKISNSDSLTSACHGFYFWIQNNSGSDITINSVVLLWSSPTAYYRYARWQGTTVFNRSNPKAASGELISFSPQTISSGESVKIEFDDFRTFPNGGSPVNMNNTSFNIAFSDGSIIEAATGDCP
ncbi:MAG: hypothetical protein PHN52_10025, partial [candidate division Zixibacteria bacterium]|nr:hypothetical protein [candidate division Zixibacteria bacterium]